jgi:hypothetical protein
VICARNFKTAEGNTLSIIHFLLALFLLRAGGRFPVFLLAFLAAFCPSFWYALLLLPDFLVDVFLDADFFVLADLFFPVDFLLVAFLPLGVS